MRIALFGGSFNPPHLGHVLCALYAYKIASLDQLWVLPALKHPYHKDLLEWDARWQLCEAAFAGLDFVHLRDDELQNESGRTFDLLHILKKKYPQHEWYFVGGSDTQADMPKWYRGQELLEQVTVIEVPRQGFDNHSQAALPAISSTTVRERLARSEAIDDIVPHSVAELITAHKWYV